MTRSRAVLRGRREPTKIEGVVEDLGRPAPSTETSLSDEMNNKK